jgi:hypothetical protein
VGVEKEEEGEIPREREKGTPETLFPATPQRGPIAYIIIMMMLMMMITTMMTPPAPAAFCNCADADKGNFEVVPTFAIFVLDATSIPPAPLVTGAQFAETGAQIVIT